MNLNRFLITSFFVTFTIILHAQTERLSFKLDTKNTRSKKTTFSLQNEKTEAIAFLISDRKQIHANLFDADFNVISKFTFDGPKSKYAEPLGYSANNSSFNLLYSNSRFSDFIVVSVDFDGKTSTTKQLDFELNKELYIDTVLHDNQLFLLTSDKETIFIRTLNDDNNLKLVKSFKTTDVSTNKWIYAGKEDLWGFFYDRIENSNITKIDHRIPTSIEQASSANKIYKFDDRLIISFEDDENGTLMYNIDLLNFNVTEHAYKYPKGKLDDFKRYNSFIYEDKIFQIASSWKEMSFVIKDYEGNLTKEFYVTKEDSITFKNGPIIQQGQTALPFQNRRELEASSKYLRKISSGKIGVSILKENNLYEITLGGYKLVQNASVGFGVGFGGGGGTFVGVGAGGFIPVFNPTFFNYNSYSSTKATYFDTVLTENFEHVKKEFNPTLNERIDDFMVDYKGITGEDLFFIGNKPFYAYINQKMKEFVLVEF